MRSRRYRTFIDGNGSNCHFNNMTFKKIISEDARKKGICKSKLMNDMAVSVGTTVDAIKNWLYGYNGPSDLDIINLIAKYLECDVDELLLVEDSEMEDETMNGMTLGESIAAKTIFATKENDRNSLIRMYQAIFDVEWKAYQMKYDFWPYTGEQVDDGSVTWETYTEVSDNMSNMWEDLMFLLDREIYTLTNKTYEEIMYFLCREEFQELDDECFKPADTDVSTISEIYGRRIGKLQHLFNPLIANSRDSI